MSARVDLRRFMCIQIEVFTGLKICHHVIEQNLGYLYSKCMLPDPQAYTILQIN